MNSLWHDLLNEAKTLHVKTPELQAFAPFPDELEFVEPAPWPVPAANLVREFAISGTQQTQPLIEAIRRVAPVACWMHTYTEDEVGADFLNRYGYIELIGPRGVFRHPEFQAYIGYWGEGLFYDWHHHEAEELYFNLAGGATFLAEGLEDITLPAGGTRAHVANQNHAMRTDDSPILTYVIWRGKGVGEPPKMGRAA